MCDLQIPASEIGCSVYCGVARKMVNFAGRDTHFSVGTSCDSEPLLYVGPSQVQVPPFRMAVDVNRQGVHALVVGVFVTGMPPSEGGVNPEVKTDPVAYFHLPLHELGGFLSPSGPRTWRVASNALDMSKRRFLLSWTFAPGQRFAPALLERLQALHVPTATLQSMLGRASGMRAKLTADAVANLSGMQPCDTLAQMTETVTDNYFRVPCCMVGPNGQEPVPDLATWAEQQKLAGETSAEPPPMLDFTQAEELHRQFVLRRPEYYGTILAHAMLGALVDLAGGRLPMDNTASAQALAELVDQISATPAGIQQARDAVFRRCVAHAGIVETYVPDSTIAGMGIAGTRQRDGRWHISAKHIVDGAGESQLQSGINYRMDGALKRQRDAELGCEPDAPVAFRNPMTYSSTQNPGDCEDASFRALGAMVLWRNLAPDAVPAFLQRVVGEHHPAMQAHVGYLVKLTQAGCGESSRRYANVLGIALGASIDSVQSSDLDSNCVRDRESQWTLLQRQLASKSGQGHCWNCAFTQQPVAEFCNGAVKVYNLQDIAHAEQTALTVDASALRDESVSVNFASDKPALLQQLQPLRQALRSRTRACSARNALYAQCLQKRTGRRWRGVQLANNRDPAGFLQHAISYGSVTVFGSDAGRGPTVLTPTSSVPRAIPQVGIEVPVSAEERAALAHCADAMVAQFPLRPALCLQPPHLLQRAGRAAPVCVFTSVPAGAWRDPEAAFRERAELARGLGAAGFEVRDQSNTLLFFDN